MILGFYEANGHPIIVEILVVSTVEASFVTVLNICIYNARRQFDYQAEGFATNLGYSLPLARALIKVDDGKLEPAGADWLYSIFASSRALPGNGWRDWGGLEMMVMLSGKKIGVLLILTRDTKR